MRDDSWCEPRGGPQGMIFQRSCVGQKFVPNLGTWEVSKLKLVYVRRKQKRKQIEEERDKERKETKREGKRGREN